MRDIAAMRNEFEASGIPIILLTDSPASLEKLDSHIINSLPSTVTLGSDINGTVASSLEAAKCNGEQPAIIIADTFNRVVFASSGYNIGLGQKLIDTLRRIE
ncbi:MAG: hypothetical protein K2G01_06010 [Paramuribaculum sp.]|nr:hypothetical protein [Paramuribaculum sp.]